MLEVLSSRLKVELREVRGDLVKGWTEINPLFDLEFTQRLLDYANMREAPDLFAATETAIHVNSLVQMTDMFQTSFQEIEMLDFHRKISDLLGSESKPPLSELERSVHSFLVQKYLATPQSDAAFKAKTPVQRSRNTGVNFPCREVRVPLGLYFGQVEDAVPTGFGALIMEHNGRHEYPYRNGDVYVGEFTGGQISGLGLMILADGTVLEGQWEEGQLTGRGLMKWPDGSQYEGDLLHGQRHGQGSFKSSDGGSYTGDWLRDKRDGYGVYTHAKVKCQGEWREDCFVVPDVYPKT